MRKYFGVPVEVLADEYGWRCEENGDPIDPDNMRPIVDAEAGTIWAIKPNGEAIIVHSYPDRTSCARDFALFVWNKPEDWDRPAAEPVVRCVGELCCEGELNMEFASNWRITSIGEAAIKAQIVVRKEMVAGEVEAAGIGDIDVSYEEIEIGPEHTIFGSCDPEEDEAPYTELYQKLLNAALFERFGAPYNILTGEINPAYSKIYEVEAEDNSA
jgi:hypothetical protein